MKELPAFTDLALEAGREIMKIYDAGFETITKLDGSPVTIADQHAEAIILDGLHRIMPGVPVIAEEEVAAGRIQTIGERFFLIDPVDGTREFVERETGEFTVNIGLIEHGAPIAGVVYQPVTGALYFGAGDEAFHVACDAKTAMPASAPRRLRVEDHPTSLRLITSRRSKSQKLDKFIANIKPSAHLRVSSSLKFCLLANGECELYPRFGEVSEWDAAAGHAVLKAAGGNVMRPDGAPLVYGERAPDFSVHGMIAYAGKDAEKAARSALS